MLAALGPVAIWSSDLARAAGTAAAVGAEAGLEPQLDPRLREFDVGPNRQGLTSEEFAAAHPEEYAALMAGEIDSIPGRESRADVLARYLPALTSYAGSLEAGETGVLVSHGAALRVAVPAFLGWATTRARASACWPTAAGWCSSTPGPRGPAASSAGGWRRGPRRDVKVGPRFHLDDPVG